MELESDGVWQKILAELEAIRTNPPWEFYGLCDAQRCFFCGADKADVAEETPHVDACLYALLRDGVPPLPGAATKGEQ